jgi:hypothetical protein
MSPLCKKKEVIELTIFFVQRIIPRLASSSIEAVAGRIRGVAQPGSATALGAVGREFESLHPDHIFTGASLCGFRRRRK